MDWVAAIFILVSAYVTGKRIAWGWLSGTAGSIILLVIALQKEVYGLVLLELAWIAISIFNYIKWIKPVK